MSSKKGKKFNADVMPKCIRCSCELVDDFQLIFDDTGLDLELQKLLGICFNMDIKISLNEIQALCEDCLNELIDAYDIIQRNEEEAQKRTDTIKNEATVKTEVRSDPQSSHSDCEYIPHNDIPKKKRKSIVRRNTNNKRVLKNRNGFKGSKRNTYRFPRKQSGRKRTNSIKTVKQIKSRANSSKIENVEELEYLKKEVPDYFRESKEESNTDIANEKFVDDEGCEGAKDDPGNDSKDGHNSEDDFNNVDYLDEFDEHLDFKEYKNRVVQCKFQDICFPEGIKCRMCSDVIENHMDMLKHTIEKHCVEDFAYPCILEGECESSTTTDDLSIHLVFKHYDLNSLVIYCKCPECEKLFNDIPSYNKHSCYQQNNVSRKMVDCDKCGESFTSNKRYRFHLQFHLENRRPKACIICDKLFRDQDEFFEHVMYSHDKINGHLCLRCDKIFVTDETFKQHEMIHSTERRHACILCSRSYIHKHYLNEHMISNHGAESPFKCHICDNYFVTKTVLANHILTHNKPKPTEVICCNSCGFVAENEKEAENHLEEHEDNDVHTITDIIDKAYCCEYCELSFNSINNLLQHRILHSRKAYYCAKCPESFEEYKDLKNHKFIHPDYPDKRKSFPVIRHYVCDLPGCTRSYFQWISLKAHKKHHQLKRPAKCPKCKAKFENVKDFDEHMEKIHNGYDYDCQFCDKTYPKKLALGVHIARKHTTEQYQCDSCSYSYPSEELLEKHKFSMHKDIPCEICGTVLKTLRNHQLHMRVVHEKEKRYFCKFCEKGFFKHCDAVSHEQSVHLKVKRYKCDLCPYEAVYKGAFTVHMRAHRNESPFVCHICGRGFRKKYSLKVHIKRHNNIRDFKCPFEGCGYAYAERTNLTLHIRLKHTQGCSEPKSSRSISRSYFNVPSSKTFIDDDDGLDIASDEEPRYRIPIKDCLEESSPDDPNEIVFNEDSSAPAVVVQMNFDHDYIVEHRYDYDEDIIVENCEITEVIVDSNTMDA